MSKSNEWREAIEKAKGLEQRFELSDGTLVEVAPAGLFITPRERQRSHIEVDDEELVRLGSWLYETFHDETMEKAEL